MLGAGILSGAYRLDAWLKAKVGRPYTMILAIGLGYGISGTVRNLTHPASTQHAFVLVATTAFQLVLLLNQVSQLHEYRQAARARRAERRARRKVGSS